MPPDINYRHVAHASLKRSMGLQQAGDDASLVYAALELRMAMEALTYERAQAFKDDFPPAEYATWQPKKVMAVLLEIDGNADKDWSVSIGEEDEYGKGSSKMESVGKETVLNMKTIKKNYDAIGSHLHIPTIEQFSVGKVPDFKKFRTKCGKLSEYLSQVLDSPISSVVFQNHVRFDCHKCGVAIRRRFPHGSPPKIVECFDCVASYMLTDAGNGKVLWEPLQTEVKCPSCKEPSYLWRREVVPKANWACPSCSSPIGIALGVVLITPPK